MGSQRCRAFLSSRRQTVETKKAWEAWFRMPRNNPLAFDSSTPAARHQRETKPWGPRGCRFEKAEGSAAQSHETARMTANIEAIDAYATPLDGTCRSERQLHVAEQVTLSPKLLKSLHVLEVGKSSRDDDESSHSWVAGQ
jgi:hypothetical protein